MKLNDLLKENKIVEFGFPVVRDLVRYDNKESDIISTLSPSLLVGHGVNEYYGLDLPRDKTFNTGLDIIKADINVSKYRLTALEIYPWEMKNEHGKHLQKELTVYEFKDALLQLFDGVSTNLLAWFEYLCEENISYIEIYENESVHEDTSLFFERLSTLFTTCDKVWEHEINNQKTKSKLVKIEFSGIDLDINSRMFIGLFIAERIFPLRKLETKDLIMVSFYSPKVVSSFFVMECSVVNDLSKGIIDIEEASRIV